MKIPIEFLTEPDGPEEPVLIRQKMPQKILHQFDQTLFVHRWIKRERKYDRIPKTVEVS